MATTTQVYNHVANLINSGQLPAGSVYKVELLNNSATFDATATTKTAVDNAGAYEVYGSGWTQGGETLTGVTISITATTGSKFTANSPTVTLSGGNLTWYKYLIYCDTIAGDAPLYFVTLNAALTVTDGNIAGVSISSNGIHQLLQAA